MKIAFWSPMHGTGTTSNLMALALTVARENSMKTLVTQSHFSMNNLEKPLVGKERSEEVFNDTGLDAVMRHFKSGNLTEEQVGACSMQICENLFLLAGTRVSSRESFDNSVVRSMLTRIISQMEIFYDIILVDTNSGNDIQSLKLIEDSDVVVVTFRQNREMIEKYAEMPAFEGKRVFYLFGSYDDTSKYNLNNLRHLYRFLNKRNSAGIKYDTGYMDAICEGKIIKYITDTLEFGSEGYESDFCRSLRLSAEVFRRFISEVK